jgi:hypothetical protein
MTDPKIREKVRIEEETRSIMVSVCSLEVAEGLHAFKKDVTTKIRHTGRKDETRRTSEQGLVDDQNLELLESNQKFEIAPAIVIPEPWQVEYGRSAGHYGLSSSLWDVKPPGARGKLSNLRKYIFDEAVAGNVRSEDVFRIVGHIFPLRSWADGKMLVPGLLAEYITAHMDDGCYDLEKLIKHLSSNPAVRPGPEERFSDPREAGDTALRIEEIPGYNSAPMRSRYVPFYWTPTEDQAWAILDRVEKSRTTDGLAIWEAVFDLDLLGLRAAGAAYYDDFYASRQDDRDLIARYEAGDSGLGR